MLARGCTKLRTFIVKGRSFIDNEAVFHLANYCPMLEAVNLNGAIVRFQLIQINNFNK